MMLEEKNTFLYSIILEIIMKSNVYIFRGRCSESIGFNPSISLSLSADIYQQKIRMGTFSLQISDF